MFLDRWYLRFRNFDSVIIVDIIRVKSYVDSFFTSKERIDYNPCASASVVLALAPSPKPVTAGKFSSLAIKQKLITLFKC